MTLNPSKRRKRLYSLKTCLIFSLSARPLQAPHMPYPYFNDPQISYHAFQEQQRQPETYQSLYGKMNIQVHLSH